MNHLVEEHDSPGWRKEPIGETDLGFTNPLAGHIQIYFCLVSFAFGHLVPLYREISRQQFRWGSWDKAKGFEPQLRHLEIPKEPRVDVLVFCQHGRDLTYSQIGQEYWSDPCWWFSNLLKPLRQQFPDHFWWTKNCHDFTRFSLFPKAVL